MPTYKGLFLEKYKDKTGGKNKSDVDGFYRAKDTGEEFFIKQPEDKKELFTELLAGLFLQEFTQRIIKVLISEGKLPKGSEKSLIFADLIQLDNGSYALIQPKVAFIELFKIIGTGYKDGSDRDPLWEMVNGPSAYPALTQNGEYFGLSLSIMFSLLFCAHSVHSGNMVCLKPESSHPLEQIISQFGRIDWGDAFRFFALNANNEEEDILFPAEYEGLFNLKKYTKGYIQNYRNIAGLFTAIAEKGSLLAKKIETEGSHLIQEIEKEKVQLDEEVAKANELSKEFNEASKEAQLAMETLRKEKQLLAKAAHEKAEKASKSGSVETFLLDVVTSAFRKIPGDLLDSQTHRALAQYLAIPAFEHTTFGKEGNYSEAADEFARVLKHRLGRIMKLKEQVSLHHAKEVDLYQSVHLTSAIDLSNDINDKTVFSEFVENLTNYVNDNDTLNLEQALWIDFSSIDLQQLVKQYNHYIELSAQQAEVFNLWQHHSSNNKNGLVPYNNSDEAELQNGHAFVPYYRESTILRRLSIIDPQTLGTYRFKPYEEPARQYSKENPVWKKLEDVASAGNQIIGYLKAAQHCHRFITEEIQSSKTKLSPKDIKHRYKEGMQDVLQGLSDAVRAFNERREALMPLFASSTTGNSFAFDSNFFYPINDKELNELNGVQLATICLEELNAAESPLLFRIINNNALWQIISHAITENESKFKAREDDIPTKLARLNVLRESLGFFHGQEEAFKEATALDQKELILKILQQAAEELPQSFQIALAENLKVAEKELQEHRELLEEFDVAYSMFEIGADQTAAFLTLKEIYKKLPPYLQESEQEKYKRAETTVQQMVANNEYVQKLALFERTENKLDAYLGLSEAYEVLPSNLKEHHQQTYKAAKLEVDRINTLIAIFSSNLDKFEAAEKISDKASSFSQLITAYQQLPVYFKKQQLLASFLQEPVKEKFKLILTDRTLWEAVSSDRKETLSANVAADLLALKQFHDDKLALNKNNQFGQAYTDSLDNFYKEAVKIRLSDAPVKEQASAILQVAHQQFAHRHDTKRLIADVIMVVSIIGLFIGAGRLLAGSSFFFSQAKTARETEFTNQWLKQPVEDNEGNDQIRLVSPPAA
ncbi:hypothetical protein A8135_09670 [Legionella jamestowniensis]|uniref:Effector protein B, substrate of the Dot/Icm secretion system n=1 Tax=Legionella jamestowniensis TaxID=455 RepID=A0ABX2XWI3_9GAMM|nr:LepB GTPase-activating domain-containing protein [Legionella jamestowniensis]OCH99007.1 hypothetical protein A8135_09670 [Legionella jamestowniensis]